MLIKWHMSQLSFRNHRHETELLAAAIAENLATISGSISVFTEGMPGVLAVYVYVPYEWGEIAVLSSKNQPGIHHV